MVLLTTLSASLTAGATRGLSRMGDRTLLLRPVPARASAAAREAPTLDDLAALAGQVPGIERVTPVFSHASTARACGRTIRVMVSATDVDWQELAGLEPAFGRLLHAPDVTAGHRVAVVGQGLMVELPCLVATGTLDVHGLVLTVVGVLRSSSGTRQPELDRGVVVPATTWVPHVPRGDHGVSALVRVGTSVDVAAAAAATRRVLRTRHRVAPEVPDPFTIETGTEAREAIERLERAISGAMVWLLALSLLVAAIGVVNALTTAVLERTVEIGVRRAVGARRRQVMSQFVAEALAISSAGGGGGVLCGAMLGALAAWSLDLPLHLNVPVMLAALSSSVVLGVCAGGWPALLAARVAPIDALRRE
jgi:ABC-type antimicrobial peptide transport system permease subunit